MLDLKNVSKTFHPGTVNARTALNDLTLHLDEGDFVTVIGGNGGQIHAAERHRRHLRRGLRQHRHRRAGRDPPAGV